MSIFVMVQKDLIHLFPTPVNPIFIFLPNISCVYPGYTLCIETLQQGLEIQVSESDVVSEFSIIESSIEKTNTL